MKLKDAVSQKYGTVGKMFKAYPFSVTREHLYRIINGEVSTTLAVANEIAQALDLTLGDVHEMLQDSIKEHNREKKNKSVS